MKQILGLASLIFILYSFDFLHGDPLPDFIAENYSQISEGQVHLYQTYTDVKGFVFENDDFAAPVVV
ncbi:MAG: hypothetical protein AAF487_12300, partial [Bacteroidota bacterium]